VLEHLPNKHKALNSTHSIARKEKDGEKKKDGHFSSKCHHYLLTQEGRLGTSYPISISLSLSGLFVCFPFDFLWCWGASQGLMHAKQARYH
jgi:hypothetical protein